LLNGNEKSTLLEEKKRESIAIYRNTLRPSQWKARLIVTRHEVSFSVVRKAYTQQQESAILYDGRSFCSLLLFHSVILLK
jgi:hypothetical protein